MKSIDRNRFLLYGFTTVLLSVWLTGCNKPSSTSPSGPTNTVPPAPVTSPPVTQPPSTVSETPVTDAINRLLKEQATTSYPVLPRGTKLLGARVKDGVAYLDFNSAFNQLANMGDTTESEAQKALRRALQGIPGVRMMAVTVEGKPFQSQMTDWTTPFPVADLPSQPDSQKTSERNEVGP
ncbi:GerMN domain-containing protein [Chthonomonas calidirosea]|uniref:GerMN domain-containing protein n=1 Tax=Chthonomonas calidirosea TaxID=454171 RepID=UPI0006ECC86D|nr:GerMN domain-containing protein [Chthonomonas calidirosea]CEK19720.1 sporulation/spore germination protein [Chthonomonas calidirosea]